MDLSNYQETRLPRFSDQSLEALAGGALSAIADANAMLACAQTRFILSHCFQHNKKENVYQPVLIKFHPDTYFL